MSELLAPGFLIAVPHLQDPNFRAVGGAAAAAERRGRDRRRGQPARARCCCATCAAITRSTTRATTRTSACATAARSSRNRAWCSTAPSMRTPRAGSARRPARQRVAGTLGRLCNLRTGRFQCYSGYAGWGPGQLEREIGEGAWIVAPVDPIDGPRLPPDEVWIRLPPRWASTPRPWSPAGRSRA